MSHPTITAIIFDLGNVLIRVDEIRFAKRLAARTGQRPEDLANFFHQSPIGNEYASGRLTSEEFYDALAREMKFQGTFTEFVVIWNDVFDPIDESLRLATRLKGKLPRIILSNTNALHLAYLNEKFPGLHDFDGHIFSHEIGLLKPDVRIYEHALQKYHLEAASTLFIDDLAVNIAGARAVGLQTIHCLNFAQMQQELTNLGIPTI